MTKRDYEYLDDWDEFDAFDEFDEYSDLEQWDMVLYDTTMFLSSTVFLSNHRYTPQDDDNYHLGFVEPQLWWTLVEQLGNLMDLHTMIEALQELEDLLRLDGVPSQVLEDPLGFLTMVLGGNLPPEPTGRKVGSPKLVKIARVMVDLLVELSEPAQAAIQAWANMQRGSSRPFPADMWSPEALRDLLESDAVPPPIAGFSAVIALSMMHWPDRGEDLDVPPQEIDPSFYGELLSLWEALPDSPIVTEEGAGSAEALFAQGQLAHMLAETGTIDLPDGNRVEGDDLSLIYSRLSRAILWLHNQCRKCSERQELTCKAASGWPQQPTPLIDLTSEIANTGHIAGCVRM